MRWNSEGTALEWDVYNTAYGTDAATNPAANVSVPSNTGIADTHDLNRRLRHGNIYGGCYNSGHINGNVVINLNGTLIDDDLFDEISETGKYYVYFKLGSGGMSRWTSMCGHNRDARTVLMVDGAFYTIYDQALMMSEDEEEWVRCDVMFDEITAKGVVKHAKDNYTYFNPDASSWLKIF